MPRFARRVSSTGIYHVVVRGVNRQKIFLDEEDCHQYLLTLLKIFKEEGAVLLGYCLMGNHLHLLIYVHSVNILSLVMKRIGTGYAWWFNKKYKRTGHLFQGRFKSEPVEDDRYLLVVIRYIHLNPVKAGLVRKPEAYRWSSCATYYGKRDYLTGLTGTDPILSLFDAGKSEAIQDFRRFMGEDSSTDRCLGDDQPAVRPNDSELQREIVKLLGNRPVGELQKMGRKERNLFLRRVKKIEGCTLRQIARVTGLGYNIIYRA